MVSPERLEVKPGVPGDEKGTPKGAPARGGPRYPYRGQEVMNGEASFKTCCFDLGLSKEAGKGT